MPLEIYLCYLIRKLYAVRLKSDSSYYMPKRLSRNKEGIFSLQE